MATDPVVTFNLKANLLQEIDSFFGNIETNMTYAVATMLDPRFKKLHFESPRAVANTITRISEKLYFSAPHSGILVFPMPSRDEKLTHRFSYRYTHGPQEGRVGCSCPPRA